MPEVHEDSILACRRPCELDRGDSRCMLMVAADCSRGGRGAKMAGFCRSIAQSRPRSCKLDVLGNCFPCRPRNTQRSSISRVACNNNDNNNNTPARMHRESMAEIQRDVSTDQS